MINRPMRILMIVPFLHYQHGGMERQAWQLAKHLVKKNVQVVFLTCLRFWEKGRYGLQNRETIDGVEVIRLPGLYPPHGNAVYPLEFTRRALRQLSAVGPVDIIHAHELFSSGLVGVAIKQRLNVPLMAKIAGSGHYGDLAVLKRRPFLQAKIKRLGAVNRFISLNDESATELVAMGLPADRILKIPNGVDTDHFQPSTKPKTSWRQELGLPKGYLLLTVGRIVPQKNTKLLVTMMEQLTHRFSDIHLVHIGKADTSSPYGRELQASIRQAKLTERIHFLGTKQDILPYLSAADAFILPSLSEGLSNVLLEAAATGLPIVASDIPGNREIIADGETGRLISPADAGMTANAIAELLNNQQLAGTLGHQARRTVIEQFSLAAISDRYLQLYQQLMSTPAG